LGSNRYHHTAKGIKAYFEKFKTCDWENKSGKFKEVFWIFDPASSFSDEQFLIRIILAKSKRKMSIYLGARVA